MKTKARTSSSPLLIIHNNHRLAVTASPMHHTPIQYTTGLPHSKNPHPLATPKHIADQGPLLEWSV